MRDTSMRNTSTSMNQLPSFRWSQVGLFFCLCYISIKNMFESLEVTEKKIVYVDDNAKFHHAPIHVSLSDLPAIPKIFHCIHRNDNGMLELKEAMSAILPEYVFEDFSLIDTGSLWTKRSNEYDVFIGLESLECPTDVYAWILLHFKGHIVFYSAESEPGHPAESMNHKNTHYFGPVIDRRENDWVLTYLQTAWWASFQHLLPPQAIVDGNLRPKRPDDWNGELYFMVYAHGHCVEYREVAAWQFSKMGPVHCGGECCGRALDGNTTNLVPRPVGSKESWRSNVDLFRNYRFCLVMEHEVDHRSYLTEKLLMAFVAGCIPVFHGPADLVFDIFNPEAFVFYNISDPQPALKQVETLFHDEDLYRTMLNQPIAAKGNTTLDDYFAFSDDIATGGLKSKLRHKLGLSNVIFQHDDNAHSL